LYSLDILHPEIFLDGCSATLAVISLGLGEFLFLQVFRKKKHYSLIFEGAVLAAAGIAGETLASEGYSGGGYILLELILAVVLIVSTLRGKPWLSGQMKRLTGFSTGSEFTGNVSMIMGLLFLTHGMLLAVLMMLGGSVPILPAVVSFIVFYSVAVFVLKRKQKGRNIRNEPHLLKGDEGRFVLELAGEKLGSMDLTPGSVSLVAGVEISDGCEVYSFLEVLEQYLKGKGMQSWNNHEILLW